MTLINKCYIAGNWCDAVSGKKLSVLNPANGEEIGMVPMASAEDANAAIDAAAAALPAWSAVTGKERGRILRKLFELMVEKKEELAQLMVLEQGKAIHEARAEVDYACSFAEWFSEEAKRIYGEVIPSVRDGQRLFSIKQPVGVVAAITPWNFPCAMIVRKLAPALAAGCTMVIKPSEETPYSALALAKLCGEAGVPAGVINVVFGDAPAIGDALTASETVRLLTFTGSTKVGRLLMEKSAQTVKKVALELGGNAPFIVFDDADLDAAVAGLIASKLRNGGQSCICANRIFLHKKIADKFLSKVVDAFEDIAVGDGSLEETNLGPMINKGAVEKIEGLIAHAMANGSEVLYKADISNQKMMSECFVAPTVIKNSRTDIEIEASEIFGPVVSAFVFSDEKEVIESANNTIYGLASYVYTEDKDRVWRVSEALEYGMVGVNSVVLSTEMASFGGIKQSGLGREGGKEGILEYLEEKFIAMQ